MSRDEWIKTIYKGKINFVLQIKIISIHFQNIINYYH